jgi:hypothetical protein
MLVTGTALKSETTTYYYRYSLGLTHNYNRHPFSTAETTACNHGKQLKYNIQRQAVLSNNNKFLNLPMDF